MYEILKQTVLTREGEGADEKAPPTDHYHARLYDSWGGQDDDAETVVLMRLAGGADDSIWLAIPRSDEDSEARVDISEVFAAYAKLHEAHGSPVGQVGPTATDDQREEYARIFERAAVTIEGFTGSQADLQLVTELRSASLALINAASKPVIPGTLVGE